MESHPGASPDDAVHEQLHQEYIGRCIDALRAFQENGPDDPRVLYKGKLLLDAYPALILTKDRLCRPAVRIEVIYEV